MEIRRFRFGDEVTLFDVFFTAVHEVAARDYSPEQIDAWAPVDLDLEEWIDRIRRNRPFVAELDDEIVGYADIQPSGYIDQFFVSGSHPRRGVGTMLMARLHQEAISLGLKELTSDVSKTAEPFFLRHGFQVVERRFPVRRGVMLENALMCKKLKRGI
ncbi:MAG: GNAT family N-acetyltransferase [Burkholderiaceae bacterium]|nr:GNAT family N-acetyltransferase [Burkholderiaceae bacterium]